ncbi:hypothetical protein HM1_1659 [Heliomicrobium modesticaldum Ice1]|uniref:Uncharacterized protein n=1 Tax=Heliobacterium modesticaldum (strain ATCC 51547 / Ice1) TaxID=498761 RepID=B0TE34_HELMI|nr:hypothetical protein HM1_1659 [Heliomicrobium modesticaldum Ice1]
MLTWCHESLPLFSTGSISQLSLIFHPKSPEPARAATCINPPRSGKVVLGGLNFLALYQGIIDIIQWTRERGLFFWCQGVIDF